MAINSPPNYERRPRDIEEVRRFLTEVRSDIERRPFKVHSLFSGGHAQTLAAFVWPRRHRLSPTVENDEARYFQVAEGVQVLAHCRWQKDKQSRSTVVIWHGMEGSTDSVYMWSTAAKAFAAGFNVVRVNYRNCGDTEHLTPTLYHGGLSNDLRVVIDELISRDGLRRLFPIGFSLGGNMVLKLLGEYSDSPPDEVVAAGVVSPSVDLGASSDLILKRSNWLYHKNFVRSMKARVRRKSRFYPGLYDVSKLDSMKTIRDFDEQFISVANGFANAEDYYYQSSSIRVVPKIRIPVLIIHAEDDPFIPFAPLRDTMFTENPYLLLIQTVQGGHVAFIGAAETTEDRFWAENRVLDFCKLAESQLPSYF